MFVGKEIFNSPVKWVRFITRNDSLLSLHVATGICTGLRENDFSHDKKNILATSNEILL